MKREERQRHDAERLLAYQNEHGKTGDELPFTDVEPYDAIFPAEAQKYRDPFYQVALAFKELAEAINGFDVPNFKIGIETKPK